MPTRPSLVARYSVSFLAIAGVVTAAVSYHAQPEPTSVIALRLPSDPRTPVEPVAAFSVQRSSAQPVTPSPVPATQPSPTPSTPRSATPGAGSAAKQQTVRAATNTAPSGPAVYLVNPAQLLAVRLGYQSGDPQIVTELTPLVKRATRDLAVTPPSVTSKSQLPPSGNRHDYLSLSVYAWPNPKRANGLPYILRDGQRNPAVDAIPDKSNLVNLINWSQELAYAYYFTGDEHFAVKAATILRTWFIAPATRMDPSLRFAQGVRGRTEGQSGGIIDATDLPKVVDAVGLLAGAASWTSADLAGMHSWFASYLDWLRTSSAGRAEAATTNNHATWYDTQVISYALFAGDRTLAQSLANGAKTKIIAAQISSNGGQPRELARPDSWSYSTYNLAALSRLAQLAASVQVDLWHYRAPSGASIRGALDYVAAYVKKPASWPYPQSRAPTMQYLLDPLYAAAAVFSDDAYRDLGMTVAVGLPTEYPPAAVLFG